MKVYQYNSQRYLFAVILPTIFMLLILIYSVINNLMNLGFNIFTLCIVITIYGLYNNCLSLSTPQVIIDDDKKLEFSAFGRAHSYLWYDIKQIRVKEFYGKKIYVRLDNKGRYWIKSSMYNNGDELYQKFTELERKLHPNLLKFNCKK
ncbi:MAG: hypothetical protein MJA31_17825 [Clostridia bacterium]|nr:hypothetical protein [Clostridia bacterium]